MWLCLIGAVAAGSAGAAARETDNQIIGVVTAAALLGLAAVLWLSATTTAGV